MLNGNSFSDDLAFGLVPVPEGTEAKIHPTYTRLKKFEYCEARFARWKACCYRLPWIGEGFQKRPMYGHIVVQDPSGLTLIGDIDTQRPRWGDGDLGVRFNRGDELTFGLGPQPYETYALMWWAREHWVNCPHHFVSMPVRMSMLLAASNRYHDAVLDREAILAEGAEDAHQGTVTEFEKRFV